VRLAFLLWCWSVPRARSSERHHRLKRSPAAPLPLPLSTGSLTAINTPPREAAVAGRHHVGGRGNAGVQAPPRAFQRRSPRQKVPPPPFVGPGRCPQVSRVQRGKGQGSE
jgi:hypothetical protein